MSYYEQCGVSFERAEALGKMLKKFIPNMGGFAGVLPQPLGSHLLMSADGVGSKVDLALRQGPWALRGIGVDLVAMNVNDILAQGGTPIAFMDYIATDQIESEELGYLIQGISSACDSVGVTFVGGETAEMVGHQGLSLAGFAVGTARENQLQVPELIRPGDVVIGLHSSGFHANGFTAINALGDDLPDNLLGELLIPTHLYVNVIKALHEEINVLGMAHITGGGLTNIARCLPNHHKVILNEKAYKPTSEMQWFQYKIDVNNLEMMRTFNCGWGFTVVVDSGMARKTLKLLHSFPCAAEVIGEIEEQRGPPVVETCWGVL